MRYGYGRVSSKGQQRDGNSLEDQEKKLKAAGCDEIVLEAYTGTTMDRPKFTELVGKLKTGDTLIVCKLDRFARTAGDGTRLIKQLFERGVSVHVLNMGLVEDTTAGRLILNIMLAFAEYEHDVILDRLNDGKTEAKAKNPNYKEGRKEIEVPQYPEYAEKVSAGKMTVKQAIEELGISRSKWYRLGAA